MHPENSYGYEMTRGFKEVANELGAVIQNVILYPEGQTDFQEEIKVLKENPPAALFIPAQDSDMLLIIPQLNHYDFEAQLLGGSGWNSDKLLRLEGKNIEGAYFADTFCRDSYFPLFQQFKERYFQRFHEAPDKVAALTYDATRLLLAGIELGAETPQSLYHNLIQMERHEGATGYITITANGRFFKHPQVFSIKKGAIIDTFWVGSR